MPNFRKKSVLPATIWKWFSRLKKAKNTKRYLQLQSYISDNKTNEIGKKLLLTETTTEARYFFWPNLWENVLENIYGLASFR